MMFPDEDQRWQEPRWRALDEVISVPIIIVSKFHAHVVANYTCLYFLLLHRLWSVRYYRFFNRFPRIISSTGFHCRTQSHNRGARFVLRGI